MAHPDDTSSSSADRFLGLLKPLERDLETYARRMLWDPHQLRDVLQNAVMKAYAAFDRYRENASFRAWMFQILTHEILNLNRKHARIARHEFQLEPGEIAELSASLTSHGGTEERGAAAALETILDDELVRGLQTLTEMERAVLLLRAVAELRYREIGEAMDIPLGSVMGYLARARDKMRAALRSLNQPSQTKRTS